MKDLAGLLEGTIEAARSLAKAQEKEGWIFT
jgi:peptidyl-dipeptidase Dcp